MTRGLLLAACVTASAVAASAQPAALRGAAPPAAAPLVDADATPETRALVANLRRLAPDHDLVGHHDARAYGVTWAGDADRSDIRDVAGQHPALVGFDVLSYDRGPDADPERYAADRARQRRLVLDAYRAGEAVTVCWHAWNPASGGSAWDTTAAVARVLPTGDLHRAYLTRLDSVAAFLGSLRGDGGELVPVLFRPYHEHNGSWFWWGGRHTTRDDFNALWRMTVERLRDVRGLHNLVWVFSPDVFDTRGGYLDRYPGDAYVDVFGFDDYYDFYGPGRSPDLFVAQVRELAGEARARGKLAAITETGLEAVRDPTWFTNVLLRSLQTDELTRSLAYVMLWRNAHDRPDHFYAPHPGHASVPDFLDFVRSPVTLLADDLPNLYRLP